MKTLLVAAVMLATGCHDCRWVSRGVCVAMDDEQVFSKRGWTHEEWQTALDETIDRSLAYWNERSIDGWTIVLHRDTPLCYGQAAKGCVVPLTHSIHLSAGIADGCPLWSLPHEIGHATYPGYDPAHWRSGWASLDADPHAVAACGP